MLNIKSGNHDFPPDCCVLLCPMLVTGHLLSSMLGRGMAIAHAQWTEAVSGKQWRCDTSHSVRGPPAISKVRHRQAEPETQSTLITQCVSLLLLG